MKKLAAKLWSDDSFALKALSLAGSALVAGAAVRVDGGTWPEAILAGTAVLGIGSHAAR